MKSESDFTRWFCGELEKVNCVVTSLVGSTMQPKGLPDRHVASSAFPQCQVWLEFKRDTGRLRAEQRRWMVKAHSRGVDCLVVRWDSKRDWIILESVGGSSREFSRQYVCNSQFPAGIVLRSKIMEFLYFIEEED